MVLSRAVGQFAGLVKITSKRGLAMRLVGKAFLAVSLVMVAGVLTSGHAAYAQSSTTGAVSGVVTDTSGAVVAGAKVTITDTATDAKQTVVSNAEGRYSASLLKPSTYKITATSAGLKSDTVQVAVSIGTTVPGDIKVTPTGDTTIVDVNATSVPLIDTQNIALATTYTEQQMQELPTPGGDVTTIAFTAPGVVVNAGGSYGNFSSNGLPGISNLFVLNGFDNQDPFLNLNNSGSSNLSLGQGEIAEATVIQNAYNSQYGRAAGAIISYTTKSGSNKFHGMANYFYNGTVLNANAWFNNLNGVPRPHAVSNQWATNVGGPIFKDKLFFFGDYEGLRYVLPNSGYLTTPTPQLEAYTLNTIAAEGLPSSATDFANQTFNIYNGATTQYNATPQAGTCGSLTGVEASPGNYFDALPTGKGAPTSGNIVPCMNQGFASANNINKEWLNTDRIDWNISDKHSLYGRFKVDHGSQPTYTSYINPLFDAVSIQPEYEGQFHDSYVISPNLTNVFVAAANWYSAYFGPASDAAASAVYPFFGITDAGLDGSGTALSPGLSLLGVPSALTQGRNVTQYQIEDDLNWVKGRHTFKFGENFRRDLVDDYDQRVETVFPEVLQLDLHDFTQFQFGPTNDFYTANSYNQAFTNAKTAHLALYNLGVYVQDEFQAMPKLKLTLGARIDRTGNPVCHSACFSVLKSGSFGAGALTDPYSSASGGPINPSNTNPFPKVEPVNFQIRAGFNYSIDERTEIRGGAGIFSDLYPASFIDGVIQNFPNYFAPPITTGVVAPSGAGNVVSAAATANATIQNGFQAGQGWGAINSALVAQNVFLTSPPAIGAYFPGEFRVPEYLEYSLQVQRQLSKSDALIVTYAGSYGYNEVIVSPFINPSTGYFNPTAGAWQSTGAPAIQGIGIVPTNQNYGRITAFTNNAHSNYSGLQVNYKRNGHGLTGQISYTWSHSLDVISNAGVGLGWNGGSITQQATPALGPGNLNYGNSDYDVRQNIAGDAVYEEPFKSSHKAVDMVIGKWVIGAKSYYHAGEPYTITTSQSGDYGDLGAILLAQTAPGVTTSQLTNRANKDAHGCVYIPGSCLDSTQYLSTQNTFGSLRRNSLYGPHYLDTDLSVSKTFFQTEGVKFILGANAYNTFNHPNFAAPGGTIGTANFGSISGVLAPPTSPYGSLQGNGVTGRILQVAGKITF